SSDLPGPGRRAERAGRRASADLGGRGSSRQALVEGLEGLLGEEQDVADDVPAGVEDRGADVPGEALQEPLLVHDEPAALNTDDLDMAAADQWAEVLEAPDLNVADRALDGDELCGPRHDAAFWPKASQVHGSHTAQQSRPWSSHAIPMGPAAASRNLQSAACRARWNLGAALMAAPMRCPR